MWEIRRLRLADDKPMELNYVYIPVKLCPELARRDVESSLYAYIAGKTGILPASVDAVYEAVNLDKHEASLLGQTTGKAAMRIVRSTYDKREPRSKSASSSAATVESNSTCTSPPARRPSPRRCNSRGARSVGNRARKMSHQQNERGFRPTQSPNPSSPRNKILTRHPHPL